MNLQEDGLHVLEHALHDQPESYARNIGLELVRRLYKVLHDLADPNYQFAGGRIPRGALLSRNADIDRLKKEIQELKKEKS